MIVTTVSTCSASKSIPHPTNQLTNSVGPATIEASETKQRYGTILFNIRDTVHWS